MLSPLWEPLPHSPWGRNVGIAPQSPCSHGIWCSNRMRARALGELWPPNPHVLVRLAVKRRPRGRGDSLGFRRLRRRNPHVPTPKWCRLRRRAGARAGTRAWGLPKGREPDPSKPEKQADFPLRWSAVLENWRVAAAGPLQISSSEHLRTGKTRFRTKHPKKPTRGHRPKANTNASSIELELVEASGVA